MAIAGANTGFHFLSLEKSVVTLRMSGCVAEGAVAVLLLWRCAYLGLAFIVSFVYGVEERFYSYWA